MHRRDVLTLGAAALMTGLMARPGLAADPAVALIERFYASLQAAMRRASGEGIAARARALSGPVNATFDIPTMTRLAIGEKWATIPGGQQGAIQGAFGRFLVASYAKQIRGFDGERFEVAQQVEQRRGGKLVRSKIIESSGATTNIDYVVAGRAIDVYLNGSISELATRRAEFEAILASGGHEQLLQSLKERTDRLLVS